MTQRLVLDSATAFVEPVVGQADQVERIGDLCHMGEGGVEHFPIRSGEIQYAVADMGFPIGGHRFDPVDHPGRVPALDHVGQGSGANIDDRCRPGLGPPSASPTEQRFIETEGGHPSDPIGVGVQ